MTTKQDDSFPFEFTDGLTKRELFAACALQGLLANPNNGTPELQVPRAIKAADALIRALQKKPPKIMKIKELIENLKQYPDEYTVALVDGDDFWFDILQISAHGNEVLVTIDSSSSFSEVDHPTKSEYDSDPSE